MTAVLVDRLRCFRDRGYRVITRLLAVVLLPAAFVCAPRRAAHTACQWALAARFPGEDLTGLTPATRAAFTAARTRALWRDGELIGLTSGYRDRREQERLFAEEVRRCGSVAAAGLRVLPPHESRHGKGTALDVRPVEGARWMEDHGARHHLYRVYDNEWWHFEYRPDGPPRRLPHPGAALAGEADLLVPDRPAGGAVGAAGNDRNDTDGAQHGHDTVLDLGGGARRVGGARAETPAAHRRRRSGAPGDQQDDGTGEGGEPRLHAGCAEREEPEASSTSTPTASRIASTAW
ncbi:D,D-peptidase/D,D-carboxypeptidase VanY-N [Amycolatopsis lurida]